MVKILLIFIFSLVLSIVLRKYSNIRTEKWLIIMIFLSIFSTIKFNTGKVFLEYNGEWVLRIPLFFIVLLSLSLTYVTRKIKVDSISCSLFILLLNVILWLPYVDNVVKYFNFIVLYASLLIIYIIFKNLKYITFEHIINYIAIIAFFNGILGIAQYLFDKIFLPGMWNESIYFLEETGGMVKRVVGLAGTNNAAGNFGALLVCIVLYKFLKDKSLLNLIILIVSLIFSILTLTRIGYMAIGIQVILYFIYTRTNTIKLLIKKYFIFIGLTLVGLVVLVLWGQDIIEVLFLNRGHTANYRTTQFLFVINNVIKEHFYVGVGPGQLNQFLLSNFSKLEIDLHSQYLNVIAEQGFLIFVVFCYVNIVIVKQCIIKVSDNLTKCLVITLFVTSLVTFNFNPNQYYLMNNLLYFIAMFGILKLN